MFLKFTTLCQFLTASFKIHNFKLSHSSPSISKFCDVNYPKIR